MYWHPKKKHYTKASLLSTHLNYSVDFSLPEIVICRISVTFVLKDGEEQQIRVPIGMSMLEAAHQNDIELEGKEFDSPHL